MSKPDPARLIAVGRIAGAFGVKGEARVHSFTDDPEACFSYGPLVDADGQVVLTPVRVRPLNEGFGVVTQEKRQREEWEALKGTLLHVPREAMPAIEDADEIYVADLIGCRVVHVDGRVLGEVKAAHNFGAGDLLEVQPESGAAFLLPFTRTDVPTIDMAGRVLTADPDEALLPEAMQKPQQD
jgi:16S rRNA processing protein RimM